MGYKAENNIFATAEVVEDVVAKTTLAFNIDTPLEKEGASSHLAPEVYFQIED